jgi:ElaB/YqjD/DUF883 family membrane-anchored ribosome-binding protein
MSTMPNDPLAPTAMPGAPSADPPGGAPKGARDKAAEAAGTAQEELGSITQSAKSEVGATAAAAGEQAKAVAHDARHQAKRVLDETRGQLTSQASEQAGRLAETARQASQQLQGVLQGGAAPSGLVADLASQAQQLTERVADGLEQRSPEELMGEVRSFARRRPGAFLAAALGAGFVVGRVVKAVDAHSLTEVAKDSLSADDGGRDSSAGELGDGSGSLAGPGEGSTPAVAGELAQAVRP